MDSTRRDHHYCADFPGMNPSTPLAVRIRLALKGVAQMLADDRKSGEMLHTAILRARLIAGVYSPGSA